VVREAIIMLEVEGYVEVRKGSGIHVISNHPKHQQVADESWNSPTMAFELLQARQLIESNIAEFAATQVTKQDIMKLMEIQEKARKEKCFRDSEWDLQFMSRWRWRRKIRRWRLSLKNVDPARA
jgi:GntR family hexuronate regulon transcriptional repressor